MFVNKLPAGSQRSAESFYSTISPKLFMNTNLKVFPIQYIIRIPRFSCSGELFYQVVELVVQMLFMFVFTLVDTLCSSKFCNTIYRNETHRSQVVKVVRTCLLEALQDIPQYRASHYITICISQWHEPYNMNCLFFQTRANTSNGLYF